MEPTFENIKPLIISAEEDGMMIKLKLKAENQDTPLETIAVVVPDQDEIMKNAMKQAGKAAAINTGINMAGNAIGSAIGGIGGQVAREASQVAGSAASSNSMNMDKIIGTDMTDEKKQAAIVTAFGHLSMYYQWQTDKWIYVTPGA